MSPMMSEFTERVSQLLEELVDGADGTFERLGLIDVENKVSVAEATGDAGRGWCCRSAPGRRGSPDRGAKEKP